MYENIIVHAVSSLFAPCFSAVKLVCLQYFFIGVHLNDTHTFLHPVRQLTYFSLSVDTVLWVATILQAAFCVRGLRLQASFACSFPLALFSLRTIFLHMSAGSRNSYFTKNPALYADADNFSCTWVQAQKLVLHEKNRHLAIMKNKSGFIWRPLFYVWSIFLAVFIYRNTLLCLRYFNLCEQFFWV